MSRELGVLLGLLVGLGIGVGVSLLLATSRKVITATDAQDVSNVPFIAEVRKAGIRGTSLPVITRPFSPAAEDYRQVASALERHGLGSDVRVLTIVSADPGEGRSMLAANLAHGLARRGQDTILVSSDLRRPRVEELLGLRRAAGLAEALQSDSVNAVGLLVSVNPHLLVLPAGQPTDPLDELMASRRLTEIVDSLRRMGIVILDSPAARLSPDAMVLARIADASLLVTRSGVTRMRSVLDVTKGLPLEQHRQLGVVLVGTHQSWRPSRRMHQSGPRQADGGGGAQAGRNGSARLNPKEQQELTRIRKLSETVERYRRRTQ